MKYYTSTAVDGSKAIVLNTATLADVVDKSSYNAPAMALNNDNFVGVIAPKAVQPSTAQAQQIALSFWESGQTALNGGVVVRKPSLLQQGLAKIQSTFLGGNGTINNAGTVDFAVTLPLKDMGIDPTRLTPYGTSGEAKITVTGKLENLAITENHEFDKSLGVTTGLKSLDFRVTGDLSAAITLSGGVSAQLGYFSQAWKEVEEESIPKLLGTTAKLTGLDSKDKIGKYPLAGLVFSVPCLSSAVCATTLGQTQTPLRLAKAGGVIIWVYLNANGTLAFEGEFNLIKVNAGALTLGLQKPAGGSLSALATLENKGTDYLLEAPSINGDVTLNMKAGLAIDADLFIVGVRIGNASAELGPRFNAKLNGQFTHKTKAIGQPWESSGNVCFTSSYGSGLVMSAQIGIGAAVETDWPLGITASAQYRYEYAKQWPSEEEIAKPGWSGIGGHTWYTEAATNNCYPEPVLSKVQTTQGNDGTITITVTGTNLPSDLLLSVAKDSGAYGAEISPSRMASSQAVFVYTASDTSKLLFRFTSVKASNTNTTGIVSQLSYRPTSPSPTPPTITTQPQSQSVTVGQTATFTVVVNSSTTQSPFGVATDTLTYKWSKNNVVIAGATSASYTTPATALADNDARFTVEVSNSAGSVTSNAAILTVNAAVVSTPTGSLPDTGITASQCYGAGSNTLVSCTSSAATSLNNQQDGMVGRDVTNNDNSDGKAGFSYSLLAKAGGGTYANTDCVKDNLTGLIWEGKPASGTRGSPALNPNGSYTNYHRSYYGTQSQMDATTNTYGYVNAVNAAGLCGYTDWRLPTRSELQSLVDYSVAYPGPTVDGNWFPTTQQSWYWTSSPYAGHMGSAWDIRFNKGYLDEGYDGDRSNRGYVRLVRGISVPPNYTYSADGSEVTDTITGLTWRRCPEGMTWSGSTCTGNAITYTRQSALQRAQSQNGWRLPNVKELSSIVDDSRSNSAIDAVVFPNTPGNWFWSSSPYVGDSVYSWGVYFDYGTVNYGNGSLGNALYVRLVR